MSMLRPYLNTSILTVLLGFSVVACASGDRAGLKNSAASSIDEATAVQQRLAVDTLAKKLDIEPGAIKVIRVSRIDWRNAGLGCAAPGEMYAQVITPGYIALLIAEGKQYRVHMAGERALVCDLSRIPGGVGIARQELLEKAAVADLAKRLGIDKEGISIAESKPAIWPDTRMGCGGVVEDSERIQVRGYSMSLEFNGRTFEYRTDQTQVQPCPDIATD